MNKEKIETQLKYLKEKQYEINYYAKVEDQIKHLHNMIRKTFAILEDLTKLIDEK